MATPLPARFGVEGLLPTMAFFDGRPLSRQHRSQVFERDSELIHERVDLANGSLCFLIYQASRLGLERGDSLLDFGTREFGHGLRRGDLQFGKPMVVFRHPK